MSDEKEHANAIRITIPREYYILPGSMVVAGSFFGMFRGGRREGLRYLAENAHRAPTTLQGWYFYNKTKQYRVMLGALRGAGADGMRLGLTAVGWVGFEQLLGRVGLDDVREIGAGVGTAAVFSGACKHSIALSRCTNPNDGWHQRPIAMDGHKTSAVFGTADWGDDEDAAIRSGESQRI